MAFVVSLTTLCGDGNDVDVARVNVLDRTRGCCWGMSASTVSVSESELLLLLVSNVYFLYPVGLTWRRGEGEKNQTFGNAVGKQTE